ncbi:uncharacterized protein LOC141655305 [Silene latifolia]|uniref:uncharacterized protein LOC141655305 n=1 Tax=Silene latifolia TaxID=37657 RepID=UPI003D78794E
MVMIIHLNYLIDSLGFWNVRGMNRVGKQKAINFFLQNKGVGLIGLLEAKIKCTVFHKVVNSFNNWCISTNSGYHNGGRMWILWQPKSFRVHLLEYNAQFIHMKVESLVSRDTFFLTMVYAFNGVNDRVPLWGHLRRITGTIVGPWAIAEDFNCVLFATERVGANVPSTEMEPFRDCVVDCGVLDIAATGSLFTWKNKQKPEERIYSRLDRVLVNKAWCDHLPDLYAHFLPEGMYDHTPCIVSSSKQIQGKRSFKYFNMWGGSKDFVPIMRSNWQVSVSGTPMFKLVKKLKLLKPTLRQLNREKYSDIENTTNVKQKQLITDEYEAARQLKELSTARDSFLSQKAKHKWVKDEDSNSAFFHGLLKQRKHGNKVLRVEDIHGKGPSCSPEDCARFLRPVSGKEVRDVMFSIPDIKSPGPDGYTKSRSLHSEQEYSGEYLDLSELNKTFVEQLLRMLKFPPEFQSMYNRRVILAMQQNTGYQFPLHHGLTWCTNKGGSTVQKGVQAALLLGAFYYIWYQRNRCRVDNVLMRLDKIAEQVIKGVKIRIRGRDNLNMNVNDLDWLSQINLCN